MCDIIHWSAHLSLIFHFLSIIQLQFSVPWLVSHLQLHSEIVLPCLLLHCMDLPGSTPFGWVQCATFSALNALEQLNLMALPLKLWPLFKGDLCATWPSNYISLSHILIHSPWKHCILTPFPSSLCLWPFLLNKISAGSYHHLFTCLHLCLYAVSPPVTKMFTYLIAGTCK